ncbi:MAG: DNA-protecting protein DprA [Spirochaetia bacterium]|nr:DNA-protecting protein DprA [Spirochaetia bacterium]
MNSLDIALSSITFLTRNEKILLKNNLDSLSALAVLSSKDISLLIGREIKTKCWNGKVTAALAEKSLSIMESQGIEAVLYNSSEYPELLKQINDAPYALFFRGNLKAVTEKQCVSVVGTRRICRICAEAAFDFAKTAAASDFCVVSGLAFGADCFAHKGALSAGVKSATCAVIPSGIDTIVPYSHKSLAGVILSNGGCILSEYIPGTPAETWRFVQRNRIIAALSRSTVVIQAPEGSGALITADFAIDFNRELMFHKSCFCAQALKVKAGISENKKLRNAASYIQDGAPVIENFADYVSVLKDEPGKHSCTITI